MNFQEVDIDLLSYSDCFENNRKVIYNKKKSLEIFTPLVFVNTMKDSYKNEYIQLNLEECDNFKSLLQYIDLHAMIHNDITQETKDKYRSSMYKNLLSCKIPRIKNRFITDITINNTPKTFYDIKKNDKARCLIYIDSVWDNTNTISLKWKIKKCCVYRNETKYE